MGESTKIRYPGFKKVICNLDYYIAVICLLFVTLYCFINVVCRFLIGKTSASMDELNIIVFVWFLYASITYCVRKDKHIRIEFLDLYLSKKNSIIIKIIADIIWTFFSGFIAYAGFNLIIFNLKFKARTSMLQIPNYILYSVILISFIAMTIFLIRNLWNKIKNLKSLSIESNGE